ncbi:MAG: hypothetical protein L3J35_04565 [Bacteroidales bacterium]|nr:hypothetical protein [Bacteroidales bacterium]
MKNNLINTYYNYFNRFNIIVFFIFFILPLIIVLFKFSFWNYSFQKILPVTTYDVTLEMNATGYDDDINISCFLPSNDIRQKISNETNISESAEFTVHSEKSGRVGNWAINKRNVEHYISYKFTFFGSSQKFEIDSSLIIPKNTPSSMKEYLETTENIQVNHPFINEIYEKHISKSNNVNEVLESIFKYVYAINPRPFKGLTDAVTAAKLNEASCNGKSRLFVALSRKAGIPARLVGGIILSNGTKKTSHQWVEAYIQGYWVPFDALNNYYAEIPANYLSLYSGDYYLFSHTSNINFNYFFTINTRIQPNPSLLTELKDTPLNAYKFWFIFTKVGIPLGLIKIIILLPMGALFVAIFRNVIGIQTFGVFLPALIAIAFSETGLIYGMSGFLFITVLVSFMHFPLERMGLLYVPKMAILLIFVIVSSILISILAIDAGLYKMSYVTLFPIVILTVTAERLGRKIEEDGLQKTAVLMIQTLFVASAAFFVMNSDTLESVFLAFPEILLLIIGTELWLGKWVGLRLTEYWRFRWLIS